VNTLRGTDAHEAVRLPRPAPPPVAWHPLQRVMRSLGGQGQKRRAGRFQRDEYRLNTEYLRGVAGGVHCWAAAPSRPWVVPTYKRDCPHHLTTWPAAGLVSLREGSWRVSDPKNALASFEHAHLSEIWRGEGRGGEKAASRGHE